MYLLHLLSGQRADPAGTPTENSGAKKSTEETWNRILKASAHHPDTGEDQTSKTDHCTRVHREGLECPHERLCSGEVHRSLRVSGASECESYEAGEQNSQDANNLVLGDRPLDRA